MDDKIVQEVLSRVDAVAAKIGVGAGELWRILNKQAFVSGVQAEVISGMFVLGSVTCLWQLVKAVKRLKAEKDELSYSKREELEGWALGMLIIGVLSGLVGGAVGISYIENFLNPEFVAFETLMGLLK